MSLPISFFASMLVAVIAFFVVTGIQVSAKKDSNGKWSKPVGLLYLLAGLVFFVSSVYGVIVFFNALFSAF